MIVSKMMRPALLRAVLMLSPVLMFAQQPPPPAPPAPPAPSAGAIASADWQKLMSGGSFLGVGVREIDSSRAKALNLREEYGVEITKVEEESPADKAGLKMGDVVIEYQGQRVEGTEQFVRLVRETPAGRTVKMDVVRGGSTVPINATIGSRKGIKILTQTMPKIEGFAWPDKEFKVMIPDVPKAMMSWRSGMIGIEGESLGDSQLASFFGVKEGVLVRGVLKGSPAEKAGIKAGDVIVKVDDAKVTSTRDITAAMRSARTASKQTFPVTVYRERRETTLSVTMEDEPNGSLLPRGRSVVDFEYENRN